MKRISVTVAALALLMGACQSKPKEFKLTATGLPEDINGTYAYVYDNDNKPVDSVLIENGGFQFVAPVNDSLVGTISFAGKPFIFAYEEGDFTITAQNDSTGATYVRGGDANSSFVKVQALNDELRGLNEKYNTLIQEKMEGVDPAEGPSEEVRAEVRKLQEEYQTAYKEACMKYSAKGSNSLIELVVFKYLSSDLTPAEYVESYDASGSMIKGDKELKKYYDKMMAAVRTDVGQQFVDYTIVNPAGESKLLSDFREEGKYFLLDFFASWCGPCKRSMPVVAELEKKYSKVLSSVSIAVWESDQDGTDYANAVKSLKITWPTMQDAKSEGADLYGVLGVPTFILFSPEAEILVRTHDINEVKAKLEELVK